LATGYSERGISYEQAIRANPDRAEPRARLAFIALARGKYQDAANKLREALTAEPGWLATAGDLQSVFREPAVFDGHVAKLEAHLQGKPEDRDAWLVLGSIWYFSGRTQKAADIFTRLSDRLEDATLRAFQLATKAKTAEDQ
jgi:cytochrome c-type biogenesis protein CcmH/NrfG